jgi:rhodanese-related sulfurtransferase
MININSPMSLPHDCVTAKWLSENMHNQHSIVLIDVRSKEEYAAMHIPSAINIPIEDLINEAILFNKENQYIIICGKGGAGLCSCMALQWHIGMV